MKVCDLLEVLKRETSKWIKQGAPELREFHGQDGYGVFSVSQSAVGHVIDYIEHQPEHHRQMTYQDEFRATCAKHEIAIDKRYVWD